MKKSVLIILLIVAFGIIFTSCSSSPKEVELIKVKIKTLDNSIDVNLDTTNPTCDITNLIEVVGIYSDGTTKKISDYSLICENQKTFNEPSQIVIAEVASMWDYWAVVDGIQSENHIHLVIPQ